MLFHTARAMCVAWSPDSSKIVSGGIDTNICIWDAKKGEKITMIKGTYYIIYIHCHCSIRKYFVTSDSCVLCSTVILVCAAIMAVAHSFLLPFHNDIQAFIQDFCQGGGGNSDDRWIKGGARTILCLWKHASVAQEFRHAHSFVQCMLGLVHMYMYIHYMHPFGRKIDNACTEIWCIQYQGVGVCPLLQSAKLMIIHVSKNIWFG